MNDVLNVARNHYRPSHLSERLKTALEIFGPADRRLTPHQLASLDHFHSLGLNATADIAVLAGVAADSAVLDVGCGVGGPARFLAATYGCAVTGVDLSEPFVEAARYLTMRTGLEDRVRFETSDATSLPFDAGAFDVVLLQHVAMNIADRAGLYRELRRVLKAGGRLATFDVVLTGESPHYPVPWARTPESSFLLTAAETKRAIEDAGFRMTQWQDDTEAARAWFKQMQASGPPPSPNLGTIMGPDFVELTKNFARNLMEGRVGILTAVFDAS